MIYKILDKVAIGVYLISCKSKQIVSLVWSCVYKIFETMFITLFFSIPVWIWFTPTDMLFKAMLSALIVFVSIAGLAFRGEMLYNRKIFEEDYYD